MSESLFHVTSHKIPASHIREYPRGAKSPEAALKLRLAIKQYTPKNSPPLSNAVTILTGNALGYPKECYEPLWDILVNSLPPGTLRAIWSADTYHQGESGVLNDGLLGDDPHWWDHSRDLLSMVNHFAPQMPQPIVGIAHSLGSAMLLRLSILHPRLMCGLAIIEPIVLDDYPAGPNKALGSSLRPDWWPDRATAERFFHKDRFFSRLDPDVLNKYLSYGLRELPTPTYSDASKGGVTLQTSKAQETWSFARGNFEPIAVGDGAETSERLRSPDIDSDRRSRLFTRAEMTRMNHDLPYVRPRVLWVFGEKSRVNLPVTNEEKLRMTGTGPGGNGGVAAGGTEQVVVKDTVHMLPLMEPRKCVEAFLPWLRTTLQKFDEEEKWHHDNERGISENNMTDLSKLWMKNVRLQESTPRPVKGNVSGDATTSVPIKGKL